MNEPEFANNSVKAVPITGQTTTAGLSPKSIYRSTYGHDTSTSTTTLSRLIYNTHTMSSSPRNIVHPHQVPYTAVAIPFDYYPNEPIPLLHGSPTSMYSGISIPHPQQLPSTDGDLDFLGHGTGSGGEEASSGRKRKSKITGGESVTEEEEVGDLGTSGGGKGKGKRRSGSQSGFPGLTSCEACRKGK
jgi:hypothetical protein